MSIDAVHLACNLMIASEIKIRTPVFLTYSSIIKSQRQQSLWKITSINTLVSIETRGQSKPNVILRPIIKKVQLVWQECNFSVVQKTVIYQITIADPILISIILNICYIFVISKKNDTNKIQTMIKWISNKSVLAMWLTVSLYSAIDCIKGLIF